MKRALLLSLFLISVLTFAQNRKQKQSEPEPPAKGAIETKTAGMKKFPGFFEFYYDEKQDKVFLVIDKFNTEILYVNSISTGVGSNDIGLDRGKLGSDR